MKIKRQVWALAALLAVAVMVGACVPVAPQEPVGAVADRTYESLTVTKEFVNKGTSTITGAWAGATPLVFEGATADAYETSLAVTDPASSDKTITLPNLTGTVHVNATTQDLTAQSARIGGGYYSTGCDISSAGVAQCVGGITSDGAILGNTGAFTTSLTSTGSAALNGGITVDTSNFTVSGTTGAVSSAAEVAGLSAKFGGGYYSTGCTGASTGTWKCTDDITSDADILANTGAFTSTLTATGSAALNGGITVDTSNFTVSGSTGAVSTAAGLSALSARIGGGYYSTGCDISSAGVAQCVGGITSDGAILGNTGAFTSTLTATGSSALNGGITVDTSNFTVDGGTGAVSTASTLNVTGASTLTGAVTAANDVTVSPVADGGNALAVNQFIGVPRIAMSGLGLMADGTSQTVLTDIGDSETPATKWTAIDADVVASNDSVRYRQGTASLKLVVGAAPEDADGVVNTLAGGNQDWSDDESVGFWMYASEALDLGDVTLVITDTGPVKTIVNVPAIAATTWTWQEVNISGVANASKDVISDIALALSAAGAAKAPLELNFDFIVKWDGAAEQDLGYAILQDGVMSVVATDMTNASATTTNLVEYTNYFVHYQSGNDAVVPITDLDDADLIGMALVAY